MNTRIRKPIEAISLTRAKRELIAIASGKEFRMTGFVITAINSDAVNDGEFALQDGDDATTRIPFLMKPDSHLAISHNLNENDPIVFSDAVNIIEIAGDIKASVTVFGWEK